MSTTIEWTQRPGTKGETWNPVVGCTKVSAGCKHCYAKTMHDKRHKAYLAGRLQNIPQYAEPFEKVQLMHERLALPLKWKKPRTIFVNSVSDLFHEDVPFEYIDRVFAIMALTPQHTYQVLTKRPKRMAEYFSTRDWFAAIRPTPIRSIKEQGFPDSTTERPTQHKHPLPNVWLGTSVENQATADERIPHLLKCPATVRFLSCEPLLGPVDLTNLLYDGACAIDCLSGLQGFPKPHAPLPKGTGPIHWVITGGESGPGARPMHPDWARSLRDQCKVAGVPFFFKQWGEWHTAYSLTTTNEAVFYQFQTFQQWVNKASTWVRGGICLDRNGKDLKNGKGFMEARDTDAFPVTIMHKVGKKNAGHLIDGVEHHDWPVTKFKSTRP